MPVYKSKAQREEAAAAAVAAAPPPLATMPYTAPVQQFTTMTAQEIDAEIEKAFKVLDDPSKTAVQKKRAQDYLRSYANMKTLPYKKPEPVVEGPNQNEVNMRLTGKAIARFNGVPGSEGTGKRRGHGVKGGYGVKAPARLTKGTAPAKAFMARLRAMRKC